MATVYESVLNRARGDLIGKTCFPIYLRYRFEEGRPHFDLFHLAVWLAGNDVRDFMVLGQIAGSAPIVNLHETEKVVLFSREGDRDAYRAWTEKMRKWFVRREMGEEFIPSMPLSGSHVVHMTEFRQPRAAMGMMMGDMEDDHLFKAWAWIANNCEEAVWRVDGGFAFTSAEEAVKFKLSFDEDDPIVTPFALER